MWKVFLSTVLFSLPSLVSAAGLVPCGGPGEPLCQTCHFVGMVERIADWLAVILGIVAVIMIIIAGIKLVTSAGNTSAMANAKKTITNLLIGYAIVLSGWLIVNEVLKPLLKNQNWNVLSCVDQPLAQQWSRPTASGDSASVLQGAAINSRVNAITSSGALQADIEAAAAAAGINDPDKVKLLKALISQESANCTQKTGPDLGQGVRAYGCGQMLVSTARTLDQNGLKGLSDAQVADKLLDDGQGNGGNGYSLTLSAQYYSQLLNRYNGNIDMALAAYNGGPGANQPSKDCPEQMRWQCVWDSPGCYGTGRTDCKPNEGPNSYAQTRNYVSNITNIANSLRP